VNSVWKKKGFDDIDTCQKCRSNRRIELTSQLASPVTPIVPKQHRQNAMSTLEMIEQVSMPLNFLGVRSFSQLAISSTSKRDFKVRKGQ
jgi:hypothetical protein